MDTTTLRIDRRFCGPPDSGNGGYVCGALAGFLEGAPAVVRLRTPPPLDTALSVRRGGEGVALLDGERVVAEARPAQVTFAVPAAPTHAAAESAARGFRGFASHWFPSCFVCGPQRSPGDGLCIFPGPLDGSGQVAAPWTPDASLADGDGRVRPEFLWAALDCPGAFSFEPPRAGAVLLGELAVALSGDVFADERCVLLAWQIEQRGRKHHTATALYGASGACRGVGLATWIEVAGPGAASGA